MLAEKFNSDNDLNRSLGRKRFLACIAKQNVPRFMKMDDFKHYRGKRGADETRFRRARLSLRWRNLNIDGDEGCIGTFCVDSVPCAPYVVCRCKRRMKRSILESPAFLNVYLFNPVILGTMAQDCNSSEKYPAEVPCASPGTVRINRYPFHKSNFNRKFPWTFNFSDII